MSSQVTDLARWKTILSGQCAFRSSNSQTNTKRCKHLFTNTSECHYVGCPIVQPNYVALQRSFEVIYLVTKDPEAKSVSETWKDTELPTEKDEAQKIIDESVTELNDVLKDSIRKKFEHLYSVSSTIRESTEESDLDVDDLDLEE